MDLATYMVWGTVAVFAVGAVFALAWSVSAGHWKGRAEAARLVLDDDFDDPEGV